MSRSELSSSNKRIPGLALRAGANGEVGLLEPPYFEGLVSGQTAASLSRMRGR